MLFTIGLVFMMIATVTLIVGPETQPLNLPPSMQGQLNLGFMTYRTYSIVLIVVGVVIMLGLWLGFERTRMGAQIRAAVDNRRMAESLGINITRCSPSSSPSAAAWRRSAAGSAPSSSASIRSTRSNIW